MMGHSHAISGVLGWLAIAPFLSSKGIIPLDGATVIAGSVVASGAALLPDLDHPSSTIARFLGPVSQTVSHGINVISGGHRNATHSILFAALTFGLTFAAVHFLGEIAALVVVFLMAGLAVKALHLAPANGAKSYLTVIALAGVTTVVAAIWGPGNWNWLPWTMAIGAIIHLLGDTIAGSMGVPWFWPYKGRFAIPLLPSTGGKMETMFVAPLMILGIVWVSWAFYLKDSLPIPWG